MLVEMPIKFVRKAASHCYRFMNGYRQDLDGPLLDYKMKTYSGHRRIRDIVLAEVQTAFDKRRKKQNMLFIFFFFQHRWHSFHDNFQCHHEFRWILTANAKAFYPNNYPEILIPDYRF
jgi:hypothetical protein